MCERIANQLEHGSLLVCSSFSNKITNLWPFLLAYNYRCEDYDENPDELFIYFILFKNLLQSAHNKIS